MLELRDVNAGYGAVRILFDVSLTAKAGEITCLLGRNGAGKTTAMKAIMGLIPLTSGSVHVGTRVISATPPHRIAAEGVGYIPQGRRLFAEMSVAENLEVGLMAVGAGRDRRDRVLALFPRLAERLDQRAETLSGGEQQMLATARALCIDPKVLLLDEPTEGLQPSMIALIRDVVLRLKGDGVAILLVEQRSDAILSLADRAVFLENGRVIDEITGDALRQTPETLARHLGV